MKSFIGKAKNVLTGLFTKISKDVCDGFNWFFIQNDLAGAPVSMSSNTSEKILEELQTFINDLVNLSKNLALSLKERKSVTKDLFRANLIFDNFGDSLTLNDLLDILSKYNKNYSYGLLMRDVMHNNHSCNDFFNILSNISKSIIMNESLISNIDEKTISHLRSIYLYSSLHSKKTTNVFYDINMSILKNKLVTFNKRYSEFLISYINKFETLDKFTDLEKFLFVNEVDLGWSEGFGFGKLALSNTNDMGMFSSKCFEILENVLQSQSQENAKFSIEVNSFIKVLIERFDSFDKIAYSDKNFEILESILLKNIKEVLNNNLGDENINNTMMFFYNQALNISNYEKLIGKDFNSTKTIESISKYIYFPTIKNIANRSFVNIGELVSIEANNIGNYDLSNILGNTSKQSINCLKTFDHNDFCNLLTQTKQSCFNEMFSTKILDIGTLPKKLSLMDYIDSITSKYSNVSLLTMFILFLLISASLSYVWAQRSSYSDETSKKQS